ncbi:hypothetical protein FB451DRAFT_1493027, partial [Mycena latifolia]
NNPGNNLHVSGLSHKIDTRDLEAAFAKIGRVKKASVMYDPHTRESRGFGFVTMESGEEADAAIAALNGTELMGKVCNVEKVRVLLCPFLGNGGRGCGRCCVWRWRSAERTEVSDETCCSGEERGRTGVEASSLHPSLSTHRRWSRWTLPASWSRVYIPAVPLTSRELASASWEPMVPAPHLPSSALGSLFSLFLPFFPILRLVYDTPLLTLHFFPGPPRARTDADAGTVLRPAETGRQ